MTTWGALADFPEFPESIKGAGLRGVVGPRAVVSGESMGPQFQEFRADKGIIGGTTWLPCLPPGR